MTFGRITLIVFSIVLLLSISCKEAIPTPITDEASHFALSDTTSATKTTMGPTVIDLAPPPLSQFIRRIFQDSQGTMWMGTNGDGVIRYNGTSVDYFSIDEGFNGEAVRAILEDKNGKIWFGTNRGITSYDLTTYTTTGKPSFTNYTEAQGLKESNVWSMLLDAEGTLWIGALNGVNSYDGTTFKPFALPETVVDNSRGVSSTKIVHSIMEDTQRTFMVCFKRWCLYLGWDFSRFLIYKRWTCGK